MLIRGVEISCLNNDNLYRNGVYCIKNKVNGKVYVGSSAGRTGFSGRFRHHIFDLDNCKHHSQKLQRCFNKNKKNYDLYEFSILEYCEPKLCLDREQYYLDLLDSYKNGYNTMPTAGSHLGAKRSKKTKIIMSSIKQKLSEKDVINIFKLYNEGKSCVHISKIYNVSYTAIGWTINKPNYYPNIKKKHKLKITRWRYVFISPKGKIFKSDNISKFCNENNLKVASVHQILGNKIKKKSHRGWFCFYAKRFNKKSLKEAIKKETIVKVYVVLKDGIKYKFHNVRIFCNNNGHTNAGMYSLIRGEVDTYKGFKLLRIINANKKTVQC